MKRAACLTFVLAAACGAAQSSSSGPAGVPPGKGWSCLDKGEVATLCFRDQAVCEAVNEDGKAVCRPASLAHCFTFTREGNEDYACLTDAGQCDGFSGFLKKKAEISSVSACSARD